MAVHLMRSWLYGGMWDNQDFCVYILVYGILIYPNKFLFKIGQFTRVLTLLITLLIKKYS